MLQSSLRKLNTGYFLSHYRVILKPSGSWQIPNCFQTEMCHRATSNTLPVACMWPFQIAHMREWYGAHCLQYHDPTCWSFVPDVWLFWCFCFCLVFVGCLVSHSLSYCSTEEDKGRKQNVWTTEEEGRAGETTKGMQEEMLTFLVVQWLVGV